MDEEIDRLVVRVRADTGAFARDVSVMRNELDGPFATGIQRAGRNIEASLSRAVVSGKFGFDDLKRVALNAFSEIAASSIRSLVAGSSQAGPAGQAGVVGSLLTSLLGSPGRATGGPVSGGRPYVVGEHGPELFVPGSSGGRIETASQARRDVSVRISVVAPAGSESQAFQRSARQLARAVRASLRGDNR